MTDSKYSMSEATLNGFGLPVFTVASESFRLAGFAGAMSQLGMALDTASLNIRLLTAEQGKLGKVLESLITPMFAPRSQLTAFSEVLRTRDEPSLRLNLGVEPRPLAEISRLPMAHQTVHHPCTCELKSPVAASTEHNILLPPTLPVSDKSAGNVLQPSSGTASEKYLQLPSTPDHEVSTTQTTENPKSPPPVSTSPVEASLGWLRSEVPPEFSGPINKLSTLAEENPRATAGLALVAATLYPIASKLMQAVIDEAFNNVAQKILKRVPTRLGRLISEDDDGHEARRSEKGEKGSRPYQHDTQDRKRSTRRKRSNTKNRNVLESPPQPKVEVRRRNLTPARADTRNLVSPASPVQATSLISKATRVTHFLGKPATPLRRLEAGLGGVQGIASGDAKTVGSSAGSLAGYSAGAAAGAAIGTLIFPGVGTAIGGLVGGFAGSELGTMLGEKLGGLVDRLGAPEQVSKDLTSAQPQTQSINFAPSIQVTCPNADSTEQIRSVVAQQLQVQFHGEFVPLMNNNALATRRDAALTDGGV